MVNPWFSRLVLVRGWLLMVLLILLTACRTDPNEVQSPTSSTVVHMPTSIVTSEAMATATLQPVDSVTPSPMPIVTSEEPLPTSTPLPTPTETIPGLIGPYDFPENVNPLTGETVSDPTVLQRRPLAIKVSNIARVRPQSGLAKADIIFEHITEGGITRFTAIFYTHDTKKVGSIRSGRLIDLEIPLMYDAAFGYSGSSAPLRLMFLESSFYDRIVSPDFAHGGFGRIYDPDNPKEFLEDTLFTDTFLLRGILEERGQNTPPSYQQGMAFHPDPPAGGEPAGELEVTYPATSAFWFYNPGLGYYTRWSDGVAHVDANTDEQLNAKNILVVYAKHVETDIIEDTGGSRSIQIQIWGEGPVTVFRDGMKYDGRWRREEPGDMLTFYDMEGRILPLAPGKSFFQMVPLDFTRLYVGN